ncbi:uncharacterized protein LOC143203414 [Rhynchophorus ferrugineus]|uniref:uncharacterized protein LOC143203414 n=1 Tax=Rhynchophorus ferrugineus TaxID=354439 RepID=UPI003FCE2C1E
MADQDNFFKKCQVNVHQGTYVTGATHHHVWKAAKGSCQRKLSGLQALSYHLHHKRPVDLCPKLLNNDEHQTAGSTGVFFFAIKFLILNNLKSKHTLAANCEKDFFEGVLDNRRGFITGELTSGGASTFRQSNLRQKNIELEEITRTEPISAF